MARFGAIVLISLVVLITTFVSNIEGRKLLMSSTGTEENEKESVNSVSSFARLILSSLAKGTVPSSSPSKKGHATPDNEQRFRRHLARIDRILQSVPSPGVGH